MDWQHVLVTNIIFDLEDVAVAIYCKLRKIY